MWTRSDRFIPNDTTGKWYIVTKNIYFCMIWSLVQQLYWIVFSVVKCNAYSEMDKCWGVASILCRQQFTGSSSVETEIETVTQLGCSFIRISLSSEVFNCTRLLHPKADITDPKAFGTSLCDQSENFENGLNHRDASWPVSCMFI
jgi:hypothetical protein